MDAFEQIVADDRVLRHAAVDRAHEAIDLVDPFADVDPGTEEILIELRGRMRVDVEPDVACKDPREPGLARAGRRGLDARLHDRVARDDMAAVVELRAVQRVCEQTDQPLRGSDRHLGIAVERDHEPDSEQPSRIADPTHVTRARIAAEQSIELFELAALALPPHEAFFVRVPARLAVQQVKRTATARAMPRVECLELARRALEQDGIRLPDRVRVVRQQRELELRIGVREIVELELPDHVVDVARSSQQRRDHDERPDLCRQAVLEIELGECPRPQHPREDRLQHPHGNDRDRNRRDHDRGDHDRSARSTTRDDRGERELEHQRQERQRQQVRERWPAGQHLADSGDPHGPIIDALLDQRTAGTDQVATDVSAPVIRGVLRGERDRELRDARHVATGLPGEGLDDAAIRIARAEVHPGVDACGIGAEDGFDAAGLREERLPIKYVQEPERADRILDANTGIERARVALERTVDAEEGDEVAEHARAQHRRQRPQLRDRERRDFLVGVDELLQPHGIELDLGLGEQLASDRIDPQQRGARRELGQVPDEAARQLFLDLARDAPDQVVVIQEPLRRSRENTVGWRRREVPPCGVECGGDHMTGPPITRSLDPSELAMLFGQRACARRESTDPCRVVSCLATCHAGSGG